MLHIYRQITSLKRVEPFVIAQKREEAERYQLTIAGPGFSRILEPALPAYLYTATVRAADGAGPLTLSVVQTGSFAASRPTRLVLD